MTCQTCKWRVEKMAVNYCYHSPPMYSDERPRIQKTDHKCAAHETIFNLYEVGPLETDHKRFECQDVSSCVDCDNKILCRVFNMEARKIKPPVLKDAQDEEEISYVRRTQGSSITG